jgi:hypothetical protein
MVSKTGITLDNGSYLVFQALTFEYHICKVQALYISCKYMRILFKNYDSQRRQKEEEKKGEKGAQSQERRVNASLVEF